MDISSFQSILPSRRLHEPYRSALRFVIIGNIGSFVQTGFFLLVMACLSQPDKNTWLYYVAFVAGFVQEMIPNYFISCYYTFGKAPTMKNALGFSLARAVNLLIQLIVLPWVTIWLYRLSNAIVSLIVIFVAGIINYFMQRFFFKTQKQQ